MNSMTLIYWKVFVIKKYKCFISLVQGLLKSMLSTLQSSYKKICVQTTTGCFQTWYTILNIFVLIIMDDTFNCVSTKAK